MQRAINVGRRLEFGQIHVNNMTTHNEGETPTPVPSSFTHNIHSLCTISSSNLLLATFPIGGTKGSGWGRNNSQFGIEEFVQLKVISLNMNGSESTFGASA